MPSDRKVARGDQLAALSVITDAVVGYKHPNDVEGWFRRRTDIEDRIRQAKLGAALRHLPSGDSDVNAVWMWAALLAGNLSVLLHALTQLDTGPHGRAYATRLRHEVLRVPARVITHAADSPCAYHPARNCCPRGPCPTALDHHRPDSPSRNRTRHPERQPGRQHAHPCHPTHQDQTV